MVTHKAIQRILFVGFILFLVLIAVDVRLFTPDVHADEKNYHRLVILGDPHLPGTLRDVHKIINMSWIACNGRLTTAQTQS